MSIQAFQALSSNNESEFISCISSPSFRANHLLPSSAELFRHSNGSTLGPAVPAAQPLLHKAVAAGNMKFARLLIEHGASVNLRDSKGDTALCAAVYFGWLSCARMLVEYGANVKIKMPNGCSLIHVAAYSGSSNCLKWLLGVIKSEIDSISEDGFTPLFYTVDLDSKDTLKGRLECVELLLENGANVNFQDIDGNTVSHWAANQKQMEILELLLCCPTIDLNMKNNQGLTALDLSISNFNSGDHSFKQLVEKVAERKILLDARQRVFRSVELLFKFIKDPEVKSDLLGILAELGEIESWIERLSKHVNHFDLQGFRPIFHAIYGNQLSAVKILHKYGADIHTNCGTIDEDRPNMTPLSVACLYGRISIAKYLIENGADAFCKSECGANAIQRLLDSETSDEIALKCLIELKDFYDSRNEAHVFQNAIDEGDSGGWSSLAYCADFNKTKCLQFLIEHMKNLTRVDENGNNPVIWAAFRGRYEALISLLQAKEKLPTNSAKSKAQIRQLFDPDHQNQRYGNSALHYAAYRAHVSSDYKRCVLVLLKYGASPGLKNKRGQIPQDLLDPREVELHKRLFHEEIRSENDSKFDLVQVFPKIDISRGREKFSIPWVNDVDDEPGPRPFVYIRQPVAGKNVSFPGPSSSIASCQCGWKGSGCQSESLIGCCDCAKIYEDREFPYSVSSEGFCLSNRVLAKRSNDFVIYECTESCTCSIDECPNRVVQRGISVRLCVKKTQYKGWGCYAMEKIKKGLFVLEYAGEVINEVDAEERSMVNAHKCSYIWSLDPKMDKVSEHHYAVDADRFGNVARFLNHSCDPNLVAREAFVYHRNPKFPRIAFFARRDILPGEELTHTNKAERNVEEQIHLNQITSVKICGKAQLEELGGIQGLVNLLGHNSSVTRLELSIGNEGVKCIALLLQHNTHILEIVFRNNCIGDEGAKALAEALKLNSTLQTIYLTGNDIGDEGAKAVAEAIKTNSTLQTINLIFNDIGDEGAKAIAEALKTNSTLQTIYLVDNHIGDKGAKALAEALKVNSKLQTIILGNNFIGAEGAKAVAEAIKTNSTLLTINLVFNRIGDEGASAIAEAIKANLMLETIYIERDDVRNGLISQVEETLKEIRLKKGMNYRKLICAFTASQVDSVRLRFDKMMLRFVYYPILFQE